MSTPIDAPYRVKQRELKRLARMANPRLPGFWVPEPSHRGMLWQIAALRRVRP